METPCGRGHCPWHWALSKRRRSFPCHGLTPMFCAHGTGQPTPGSPLIMASFCRGGSARSNGRMQRFISRLKNTVCGCLQAMPQLGSGCAARAGRFEDNGFMLAPGQPRRIRFLDEEGRPAVGKGAVDRLCGAPARSAFHLMLHPMEGPGPLRAPVLQRALVQHLDEVFSCDGDVVARPDPSKRPR